MIIRKITGIQFNKQLSFDFFLKFEDAQLSREVATGDGRDAAFENHCTSTVLIRMSVSCGVGEFSRRERDGMTGDRSASSRLRVANHYMYQQVSTMAAATQPKRRVAATPSRRRLECLDS